MIQKPKGTYDVYGDTSKTIKELEKLMNSLMEKYNSGNLGFIVAEETDNGLYNRYVIRIANEEEINKSLKNLTIKDKNSTLVKRLVPLKSNN